MADDPNSTADTSAEQPCPQGAVTAAAPPAPLELAPASEQPSGVVAMVRLAAVLVDPDGRIALWNRGAEELFGHRTEMVQGRTARGLLPAAPHPRPGACATAVHRGDAFDTLDDLTTSGAWAGPLPVTDREERSRSVLWWAYPLVEPDGRGLLVLAADARPLRQRGPRIAIGRRLLPYAAAEPNDWGAPPPETGCGFHRISAVLGSTTPGSAAALAPLLPKLGAARLRALLRQVAAAGAPALWVDAGTRLPVVPYEPGSQLGHPAQLTAGLGRRYPTAQQRSAAARGAAQAPAQGSSPTLQVVPEPRHAIATAAAATSTAQPDGLPAPALPAPRPAGPGLAPTPGAPLTTEQRPAGVPTPAGAPTTAPAPIPTSSDGSGPHPLTDQLAPLLTNGQAGEQLALLNEVGGKVGTTLDLDTTARELCQVLVPRVADFACVDLLDRLISDAELPEELPDDDTMLRRVARSYRESAGCWSHVLEEGALLAMPRSTPPGMALQRNQAVLVPVVNPELAVDYAAALGGGPSLVPVVSGRSMLVLPLSARGTVLGILKLLRLPDRAPFDEADAATLLELAARAALSLDNARLHRAESKMATTLQRSMIPTRPPRIPGVQIAHRYLPGDRRAEVGGDWFDAIQLPGSRVALVVGDVMGHGLHSAAAMGRFRTAMQTLAALDLPPGQLLRHLDNLAQKIGDDHLATCLYAVYDPINRTCELASAGHVPPVLVHPDGTGELLEIPAGAPIGVGGVPFVAKKIDVVDGSMLVMCTDGLVEVRGGDIGAGLAALCGNLIDPKQTPDEACDTVLDRLHSDDRKDDVALLVARFDGVAETEVATWTLAVDRAEVRRARQLVRDQLAAWQLSALSDTTELLVSELVTNAVRVARDYVQLQLIRVDKLLVEVSDDNHNLPSLEPAESMDENGRGLNLVSKLAERWGTARKAVGKVVWFEQPLPRS
ncbi:ATP-binding SpoIIE family protein phosphatase [Kitasatospora kifunensis]|uniref:protein-serine/threonine phosphatase n=1 Tax=Kitasatospora kifunensis TaxID=58351 RepID=A0A7W7VVI3_KITKI|nr:SpoIIE family protein phosphatase [Kitasatospora kifunensis]MBB4924417.1 serine phosphatase RsbU (regulator of sigma subunit) [Kitasatospora kifunensis]